jgi:hypothetical protein
MAPETVGYPEDEVFPDGSGRDGVLVLLPAPLLRDGKEAGILQKITRRNRILLS